MYKEIEVKNGVQVNTYTGTPSVMIFYATEEKIERVAKELGIEKQYSRDNQCPKKITFLAQVHIMSKSLEGD